MDKKQFLASGLLQQYVLGLTTPEETNLVEHFISLYPDIRKESNELRQAMEEYSKKYAIPPSPLSKPKTPSEIHPKPEARKWSWQVLRSSATPFYVGFFCLFLITGVSIGYLLWLQQRLTSELSQCRTEHEGLVKQQVAFEEWVGFIEHEHTKVLHLQGTSIARGAHAVAYWNATAQKACIDLVEMPILPDDKQYQLWADVHGEMINIGLLAAQEKQFQTIQFVQEANSLNITIEPKGGSAHPTVSLLMANSNM